MKNTIKPIALSAAMLLALSACGDDDTSAEGHNPNAGDEQNQDGVFTFEPGGPGERLPGGTDEIRFEIPEEVVEMAEPHDYEHETDVGPHVYSDTRVLEAVTVRSTDETDSQCGVVLDYEYAGSAHEDIDGTDHKQAQTAEIVGYDTHPDELDGEVREEHERQMGTSLDDAELVEEQVTPDGDEYVWTRIYESALPEEDKFSRALGGDDEAQYNDDYSNALVEVSCAGGPTDDDSTVSVKFRTVDWVEQQETRSRVDITHDYTAMENTTLASAEVNAMASGDLHVIDYEISGYHYDEEHGWLGDNQEVDSQGNVIGG